MAGVVPQLCLECYDNSKGARSCQLVYEQACPPKGGRSVNTPALASRRILAAAQATEAKGRGNDTAVQQCSNWPQQWPHYTKWYWTRASHVPGLALVYTDNGLDGAVSSAPLPQQPPGAVSTPLTQHATKFYPSLHMYDTKKLYSNVVRWPRGTDSLR